MGPSDPEPSTFQKTQATEKLIYNPGGVSENRQEGNLLSPAQRSRGRRTRGLLPISKELLLLSDNTAEVVQEAIATKRARAKQHYDTAASSTLPSLEIGNFVYANPSSRHKSGAWLYGLVTAILAPRSYIVETPAGLTR